MKYGLLSAAVISGVVLAGAAQARDSIQVVGSSTVFPFTTAVAEQFAKKTGNKAPVVESTGTGGGMKLFCAGVGEKHPDVTNASRPMKKSEFEMCQKNGVADIIEVKVGLDGIVVAQKKDAPTLNVTRSQLYQAFSKDTVIRGKITANTHAKWSDVNPGLPSTKIEAYGPPPTSGTRDAFLELAMEKGGKTIPVLSKLKKDDKKEFKKVTHTIREDGMWIDAGENDNAIVKTLTKTPTAVGVFGYSFFEENADQLKAAKVDGVVPTYDNISSGKYPLSRSLFIYVKKAHVDVIPGMKEFLSEYVSDAAMSEDGYLADKGLIALPAAERSTIAKDTLALTPMAAPAK